MLAFTAVILTAIGGIFSFTRQAQILQQNSYFPSRYLRWLKGEFNFRAVFSLIFLCLSAILMFLRLDALFLILSAAVCVFKINYCISRQKKSIKPLVFTARVKRQYITASVILAALSVMGILSECRFLYLAVLILSFMPCVTVLLARTVNQPVETLITRGFIADAKKKLKSVSGIKVIGITGSYGKTSTKYVLAEFLSQKYNVVFTPASFNTPLGVVRTIRESLRPDTQIFIAEMGAKKTGDIKEICDIVSPDMGIITSCGPQHLDTFLTIENVVSTKFELADCVLKKGGDIFLNFDSELIAQKARDMNCVSYGTDGEYRCENVKYSAAGAQFDIVYPDGSIHIRTKLLGMHNVLNITAAAALSLKLGVNPRDIAFAASRLKPVSHRLEMKSFIKGSTLLDDAYNSNPVGCIEAVKVLSQFEGMKKVIVTPGLVELGEKEYECNYNLGAAAADTCDVIILVGEQRSVPLKKAIDDKGSAAEVRIVKSFKEAMNILSNITDKNTVVLFENDLPDNYSK